MTILKKMLFSVVLLLITTISSAETYVVAAENFYGAIAKELGGPYVKVISIISNPNQDPHLFSTSPSTAKALANANVIIYNGVDYDPWMPKLIGVNSSPKMTIINVGNLVQVEAGANPHLWYNPTYMQILAHNITEKFIQLDPTHSTFYQANLNRFTQKNDQLLSDIDDIASSYSNVPVTATEPVFGYMASLLGLRMLHVNLQWQIMNDADPSPQSIKSFDDDLRQHKVRLLFYNNQVIDSLTEQFKKTAQLSNIPIIGVSETMPEQFKTYYQWMRSEVNDVKSTLSKIKQK